MYALTPQTFLTEVLCPQTYAHAHRHTHTCTRAALTVTLTHPKYTITACVDNAQLQYICPNKIHERKEIHFYMFDLNLMRAHISSHLPTCSSAADPQCCFRWERGCHAPLTFPLSISSYKFFCLLFLSLSLSPVNLNNLSLRYFMCMCMYVCVLSGPLLHRRTRRQTQGAVVREPTNCITKPNPETQP